MSEYFDEDYETKKVHTNDAWIKQLNSGYNEDSDNEKEDDEPTSEDEKDVIGIDH